MPIIELKNIYKSYDQHSNVIEDFNLSIEPGEFVIFLGPSGCGKSTTLRMIAGLESITEGDLVIKGQRQNEIPLKTVILRWYFKAMLYIRICPFMTISVLV